ncbi:tetratricopeptide repeat protein [Prochlorococcus sp. MIT 1303]|uniref:tetratricopeptide repeat protein n=1 Tax=Prochlorococcus sp. MIT 1303 TaxID=1723647 RepID=UPI0007B39FDF|nr:tetratricopeptide repeat protein [Prochlorococcus sp. MIT 1303]KZR69729.1 TPR repeat-containing protein YrrB [Prochlorococcus sp. MIT 1303]
MTDLAAIKELSAAGSHQECLQACQNNLQANPEEAYSYKYAGKSFLALGQFEKAKQFLIKAHQLDGSDPEIAKDIGNIFLKHGSKDTALGWYEKALEINNNFAPALNNLANLKRHSGNNQEAVELFQRAIQADPKLVQAYIGAAASYLALKNLDLAKSFADQALAINKSTPGANEILGIVFQNQSNPERAIEHYQKELNMNPHASNALLNQGLLLLQRNQPKKALEPLAKASALAPSEQCSLLLAKAYQNLGQFKEAIIEYKKLNADQSHNKLIPFNLGLCLLEIGNNEEAIEEFKIAIRLDESFVAGWVNIGSALKREGRIQEALQATQKVLDLDPDNPTAHMNLGGIYKNLGNFDQALASTLKALELKPDNPRAHINLGGIYKNLGNLDQALASTLKSLELKPDNPTAHINLGGIYKNLGNLDQALASTLKALELKPDNPTAHINLGGIYKNLGNLDQALASTLKALELKPDNPIAHINLGGIYQELGELDQALTSTLKSLELKPDNPTAHMNLGWIYKDLGNLDQALASTLKSLELKPDNPIAHINLGAIYINLGELDQALTSTLKSLELKPDNPTAHMNLGWIYKDLGNLDQALASTLKSLELKPDNPTAQMNLGMIYEIKGKKEQALKYYLLSAQSIQNEREGSSVTSLISYVVTLVQLGRTIEAYEKIKEMPTRLSELAGNIKNYNAKNKKHDQAYFKYLKALLPEIPAPLSTPIPESIHIGESHCLAFTNQIISINGIHSKIKPSLVKGAKAWHLANHQSNNHKTCFQNSIKNNIDDYRFILLSFGEIDCRKDGGILQYCSKNNSNIEAVIQSTARGYVRRIASELTTYRKKLILLGTPAPQKDENLKHMNIPLSNAQHLLTVHSFNQALSDECSEAGILFANVLDLTRDEDGFNNNKWMIDSIHLKPKAIHEIVANYLVQPSP